MPPQTSLSLRRLAKGSRKEPPAELGSIVNGFQVTGAYEI